MDAAFIALLSAIWTFISVTARIVWLFAEFWIIVPTPEAISAALGTTTFPAPFCTMTTRRPAALGTLTMGLPGVTTDPFTDVAGETEPDGATLEGVAAACELAPDVVCPGARALFCTAFSVPLRPDV